MLGVIVCYSLSTSLNVSGDKLYEMARRDRIPLFLLPEKKSPASSFRTAIEKFASKNKLLIADRDMESPFIGKSLYKKEGGGVSHIAEVRFNKNTGDITLSRDDEEATEFYNQLMEEYSNTFGKIMIKEIRNSIESAIDYYGGIKVRPNGGVVFIPADTYDVWQLYEKMLSENGVSFLDVTLEDTEGNRKAIWFAYNNHAERCIDDELIRLKLASTEFNTLNEKTDKIISAIENRELSISKANNLYQRIDYLKRKGFRYDKRLKNAIPSISLCDSIMGALDNTYGDAIGDYY